MRKSPIDFKRRHNLLDKKTLKKNLLSEDFKRLTISFYRYFSVDKNLEEFREEFYLYCEKLYVLGRVYIASEGINAQVSVPEHHYNTFLDYLSENIYAGKRAEVKKAIDQEKSSFFKLIVKIRKNIVADGLEKDEYDLNKVGRHLSAEEYNAKIREKAIVIDMRNHYESQVGRFKGAICPNADTFRSEIRLLPDLLKGKEKETILLYCTGGVRCEKTSSFLIKKGYQKVYQLKGGIVEYAHEIKQKGLESEFKGKNFVFDDRLGERVTDEILSQCHQCGNLCDTHVNCKNDACHILFIQCLECQQKMEGCCSKGCIDVTHLPEKEQRQLRSGVKSIFESKGRPLREKLVNKF